MNVFDIFDTFSTSLYFLHILLQFLFSWKPNLNELMMKLRVSVHKITAVWNASYVPSVHCTLQLIVDIVVEWSNVSCFDFGFIYYFLFFQR